MTITLCLLTLNEIAGCMHDVPLIERGHFDDIYAIDGGSKDGTSEYLKEQNIAVFPQPEKGMNAACVYAVEKCKTDAIIFFHPKGSVPVADTLRFKDIFEQGNELVVASRVIKGASNEEDSKIFRPRKWFCKCLALLSGLLWKREGDFIWDILHGFRGVTVSAFKKMDILKHGVSIDVELVSRAYKFNIRRIEFPTHESSRVAGKTHFKAIPTGAKLLKYVFYEILRKE